MTSRLNETEYLSYSEMLSKVNHGVQRVIDLTWDRRDRGGEWLVVERGNIVREGRDLWTGTARLIATSATHYGAANRAGKVRAAHRRRGLSVLVDVVHRTEITMLDSTAPYGCMAGEG